MKRILSIAIVSAALVASWPSLSQNAPNGGGTMSPNSGTNGGAPSGSAGGSLAGSYPDPTIASSVALPGSPTTTTQAAYDNSTKIATTAQVQAAIASQYASSTTGAGVQTMTNSPCTGLTVGQWIPISITGQTGTWYLFACK